MGHALTGLGTASLDTFGGLITLANPTDLPEGASPRCWDVDFIVGSVLTRAGLSSVYSYANEFVGPSAGGLATVVANGGNPWTNPNGVLGNVSPANVTTGTTLSSLKIPTAGANESGVHPWTNPTNIKAVGAPVASVNLLASAGQALSSKILANGMGFSLPTNANVVGIQVNIRAAAVGVPAGKSSINIQLAQNGNPIGAPVNVPLSGVMTTYVKGSSGFQWGTVLSPNTVNGSAFGILIQAQVNPTTGTADFTANSLTCTVFYTTATSAEALQVTHFPFSIPSTAGIAGIEVRYIGFSSAATTLNFQLMKNGLPVGEVRQQLLTTVSTSYTAGAATDLWGTTWLFSDVNALDFGVQITATGQGTSHILNLSIVVLLTPALVNFNYIKTYEQNNDHIFTFALDNAGVLWNEDVTTTPNVLSLALTGLLPGQYAKSATSDDQEYIVFSDLTIGTERPRVASEKADGSGLQFLPLSQVGPGAPPAFQSSTGGANTLALTNYSLTSNIVTFTYTGVQPNPGDVFTLSGVVGYLNGKTVSVLATGLSATNFEVAFTHANDPGGAITGTATPQSGYPIASITQNPANPLGAWNDLVWGDGPGPHPKSGSTIIIYYALSSGPPDAVLNNAFNTGNAVYVQVTGAPFGNGVWLVTGVGYALPPGAGYQRWYLTYQVNSENLQHTGGPTVSGTYQMTVALLTTSIAIPGVNVGSQITITGATPAGWNAVWSITENINSGLLNITSTAADINGVATYGFSVQSGAGPVVGQLVTVTNTLNGDGVFNVIGGKIATVAGPFFTIDGFAATVIPTALESGQGETFGTQFNFDPGASNLGTSGNSIFGPDTGTGEVSVAGGSSSIAAGTRQGVVFFITESGYETAPSPPVIFTTIQNSAAIYASQIPIGPPNVIARGIAFTEAGQNGVPGANFYVIRTPVTIDILGQKTTYTSTIIHDNVSTTAVFTFIDAVLLNSDEVDVQGHDLFNLIELGSCAWAVPYASRMFYGMQLNKVQNFNNMTFDGGYLPNPSGPIQPLGWTAAPEGNPSSGTPVAITAYSVTGNVVTITAVNAYSAGEKVLFLGLSTAVFLNGLTLQVLATGLSNTQFQVAFTTANVGTTPDTGTATSINEGTTLINSTVTGMSLYISDTIEGIQPKMGFYSQTAYQDPYGVAIIQPNIAYSVRVAASNPGGVKTGTLIIELVYYNTGTGFGTVYGSFAVPLSAMTSNVAVFSGKLLLKPLLPGVNITQQAFSSLRLAFFVQNMGIGADVQIDRIEVFPTEEPFLLAQVYGSYIDNLESIDASGSGGIIDTTSENPQTATGGFVMHDLLYLLKTSSLYSTQDDPTSEPGGWGIHEASNRVGSIGINSYDVGEEWALMACRSGIYGFDGGQPEKIMQEIYQIWDAINWFHGNSIVLRNDLTQKKMYCAIPLPTPNKWLPNAPLNLNPTVPNVMLMLNYQGLSDIKELISSPQMHTTMFGTLASVDMKRKWTIWQIPSPYMDFVLQQDGESSPLYICNGIQSSKIYRLLENQFSDDGVAINSLYTTYGFVNAAKAATLPIFGFHAKRYTVLQVNTSGAGVEQIRVLPNVLEARYPYTVPGGITLVDPAFDDWFRPLNIKGNRAFIEFSTNAVGAHFNLSKVLLTGKADPWSNLNATGGGNAGQ